MDPHHAIVTTTLAAKSSTVAPRKARSDVRSGIMPAASVLVVPAEPFHREVEGVLIAALRHEVEELVGAIDCVDAPRVAGIGVKDCARLVLIEDADSRPLVFVGGKLAPFKVPENRLTQLFCGERDAVIPVEVGSIG